MSHSKCNMKLREYRMLNEYSQKQLAIALGVSKNTIINWEKGINDIPGMKLTQLAQLFGCKAEDIYGISESRGNALLEPQTGSLFGGKDSCLTGTE